MDPTPPCKNIFHVSAPPPLPNCWIRSWSNMSALFPYSRVEHRTGDKHGYCLCTGSILMGREFGDNYRGGSRILRSRGHQPCRRGWEHTNLPDFPPKNDMKLRKFWSIGGGRGYAPLRFPLVFPLVQRIQGSPMDTVPLSLWVLGARVLGIQAGMCSFCWNCDSFQVNSQKLGVQAPQNVEFE